MSNHHSFTKNSAGYWPVTLSDPYASLPVGNYQLSHDTQRGFYLSEKPEFKLPAKIYGNFDVVDRWVKTWNETQGNLGVLLQGKKGTGKTVTAQMLALAVNRPVIFISVPFVGPAFIDFLTLPALRGCIIFIDEFEKVYERRYDAMSETTENPQQALLSILDGTFKTNFLWIFTINEEYLDDNLLNRPGRIRYVSKWDTLPEETLREVAKDRLKNQALVEEFVQFFIMLGECTMDMAVALADEMNRFDEAPSQSAKFLNLRSVSEMYDYTEQTDNPNALDWYVKTTPRLDLNLGELLSETFSTHMVVYDMEKDAERPEWQGRATHLTFDKANGDRAEVSADGMTVSMFFKKEKRTFIFTKKQPLYRKSVAYAF
jgi:hypothetical protein